PGPGPGSGPKPGPGANPGAPSSAGSPAPQVALNPRPGAGLNGSQLDNLNARLGNLLPAGNSVAYTGKHYVNSLADAIAAVQAEYYKKAAPPEKVLEKAQARIFRKRTNT